MLGLVTKGALTVVAFVLLIAACEFWHNPATHATVDRTFLGYGWLYPSLSFVAFAGVAVALLINTHQWMRKQ